MTSYLIELSHNPEDCTKAIEELVEEERENLDKFYCGDESGDHRCWAFVDAENESEVRRLIPRTLYSNIRITEVRKLSTDYVNTRSRPRSTVGKVVEAVTGRSDDQERRRTF